MNLRQPTAIVLLSGCALCGAMFNKNDILQATPENPIDAPSVEMLDTEDSNENVNTDILLEIKRIKEEQVQQNKILTSLYLSKVDEVDEVDEVESDDITNNEDCIECSVQVNSVKQRRRFTGVFGGRFAPFKRLKYRLGHPFGGRFRCK